MSDLTRFRDHCAAMSTSEHRSDCVERLKRWRADVAIHARWVTRDPGPEPVCAGCMNAADRDLFARLAAEVDDYRAPQVDLFGELADEPTRADT